MTTNERWKAVKGFTRYEVSDCGTVRNIHTKEVKAIRYTKTGYCITDLKENGKKKTAYVHRLVAEAFVDNPDNLPNVNHIDENKQNNTAVNLEWCTAEYNNRYGTHNARIKATKTDRYGKRVAMVDALTGDALCVFSSITEAAESVGVTKQAIVYALSDRNHTSCGHRWVVIE